MEKARAIDALSAAGRKPLMVGDGLNDAAALAKAHASMAPGAAVDASQNAADLVFEGEELGAVVAAIDVARAASAGRWRTSASPRSTTWWRRRRRCSAWSTRSSRRSPCPPRR